MTGTVKWPRFLLITVPLSVVMLVLYGAWTSSAIVKGLSVGYPARPAEEVPPLVPFLAIVSIAQLVGFCYLYLRVYPQRSLGNAVWWGAWGGLLMVLPDGQFFVGTPNMHWSLLIMQWGEGIVTAILTMALFQLIYRPGNEGRALTKIDVPRFLIWAAVGATLIFVLDIAFHALAAPKLFTDYPAHDFPRRPAAETQALMSWLFAVYLVQLTAFCFVYLRIYSARSMASAVRFAVWLALWVFIPNCQFFVGLDKYTVNMLAIQLPEAIVITVLLMVFFEATYRPKAPRTLAAAE
jgi:hypothetical protein